MGTPAGWRVDVDHPGGAEPLVLVAPLDGASPPDAVTIATTPARSRCTTRSGSPSTIGTGYWVPGMRRRPSIVRGQGEAVTKSRSGPQRGVHLKRIAEVRSRLAREGPPSTRDYANDFDTVTLPERDCDAIRGLLIDMAGEKVIEVGLAYASSALAIGEALITVGAERPTHIIIDPLQESEWSNVGWHLLRSAALDAIARLVPQPSSLALSQLVVDGCTADAAFVDGSHTVDDATGCPRAVALRLPDHPFEPAFESFRPF